MSDNQDYLDGYNNPHAAARPETSSFEYGRRARLEADRQRDAERLARGPELVGTRPGALAGLVVLVLLLIAGMLLWNARAASLSVLAGAIVLGLVLYGALVLLKARPRLLPVLREGLASYGFALLAGLLAGGGAWYLQSVGGPNLLPGIETLSEANLRTWEPGALTFALPLAAALVAGTWRLSRALPPLPVAWPLRWAGLAGVLALSPFVGALVARSLLGLL